MRFLIQIGLILTAVFVMITMLIKYKSHAGKAWKKVAILLLSMLMIIVVLFPELMNSFANVLGIGRGADLLLYATVAAFILYSLNNYVQEKERTETLYKLARKVSLLDANNRYEK